MNNQEKVRVRLKRAHYHNGRKRAAGTVIKLNDVAAGWLVDCGVAVRLRAR